MTAKPINSTGMLPHHIQAPTLEQQLEALIDLHTLPVVLDALDAVCLEKAEHLQVHWQDNKSARAWIRLAHRFSNLVTVCKQWSMH